MKYLTLHPARRDELVALLKRIDPSLPIGADTQFVISGEQNKPRFSVRRAVAGPARRAHAALLGVEPRGLMVFYFINQWMPTVLSQFRRHRSSRPPSQPRCSSSAARWPVCCRCAFLDQLRLSAGADPVRLRHPDRDRDRRSGPAARWH